MESSEPESELIFDEELSNVFTTEGEQEHVETETVVVTDSDPSAGFLSQTILTSQFWRAWV